MCLAALHLQLSQKMSISEMNDFQSLGNESEDGSPHLV